MATITNIRIYTQSKAVPNAGYIAIDKVMMEGNTIVAMGGDVRYVLGVVPMENIVVDAPSVPEKCGCNTANANIFATLIKGVDGITPDMSDYYNKGQVDNKLSTKQDVISDIDVIRRNAVKGANAVQPASLADYVSKDDVDAELSKTSANPVQNQAVHTALEDMAYAFGQFLNQKQGTISDLEAIRDGAAKGATALQSSDVDSEVSETSTNPVQNKAVAEAFTEIVGLLDATLSSVDGRFDSKQDKLVSGENIKTINGESIVGEGNIEIEGGSADLEGYATEEYVDNAVAEVNVKGEDGYVYSNGEKVDMRFTRSLLPVGTSIPAKANLNTVAYLKVGKYYCSLNADAKTITNCPTATAFMMEVFNPLSTVVDNEVDGTYVYRIRILTEYSTGIQYFQYCTVGSTANRWTYDSWYVCPRTKFALNSNKNDGSAAIGSKAQGVYVDSTGTLQKMTYSLNKTVPANAVFTDTNTKVTAVDNHYTPVEDESVVIEAPDGEVVIGLKRDAAGHVVGVMSTPMGSGGSGGGGGEVGPQGPQGDKGDKGDTGVGVQSVAQTTTSNADGGSNVVTVTLTDGTKSTFTVKNGSKGSSGNNGTNGEDGADGATFTPNVDSAGNLSWTNNKGLTNPPTVNIKGPKGDAGEGAATEEYVNNAIANAIINVINASY